MCLVLTSISKWDVYAWINDKFNVMNECTLNSGGDKQVGVVRMQNSFPLACGRDSSGQWVFFFFLVSLLKHLSVSSPTWFSHTFSQACKDISLQIQTHTSTKKWFQADVVYYKRKIDGLEMRRRKRGQWGGCWRLEWEALWQPEWCNVGKKTVGNWSNYRNESTGCK